MTPADDYLDEVRRSMSGMAQAVREDILRELRSHIADATSANGGNVGAALSALGPARGVGRAYRQMYGYGRAVRILFIAIAIALAVPSVPVLSGSTESLFPFTYSVVFLVGAAAWVLWVSVAAGSRAGFRAGLGAFASRFTVFGAVLAMQSGTSVTVEGLALFLASSVLLIVLGWLPGTAKQVWKGPKTDL